MWWTSSFGQRWLWFSQQYVSQDISSIGWGCDRAYYIRLTFMLTTRHSLLMSLETEHPIQNLSTSSHSSNRKKFLSLPISSKQLFYLHEYLTRFDCNGQESRSLRMVAYKSAIALKNVVARGIPRQAVLKPWHAVIVCALGDSHTHRIF
jgi:hypothetical protein